MFEDRISELPDAVILHILSFLPTQNVVRTSLLSKRWRHVWTLVPTINICDSGIQDFRRHDEGNNGQKKFYKFVDECLKHPYADTTISKFRLNLEYYRGSSRVDGWLRFLGKKTVQELELDMLPMRSRYCLPHSIIDLFSLTLLKLTGLALENFVPTSLPSLKELYLSDIQVDDRVLNSSLLSCLALEKLQVNRCNGLLNPKVSSLSFEFEPEIFGI